MLSNRKRLGKPLLGYQQGAQKISSKYTNLSSWSWVSLIVVSLFLLVVAGFVTPSLFWGISTLSVWSPQQAQISNINASLQVYVDPIVILQQNITTLWNYYYALDLNTLNQMMQTMANITELYDLYHQLDSEVVKRINGVPPTILGDVVVNATQLIVEAGVAEIILNGSGVETEFAGLSAESNIILNNAVESKFLLDTLVQETVTQIDGLFKPVTLTGSCGFGIMTEPLTNTIIIDDCNLTNSIVDVNTNCSASIANSSQALLVINETIEVQNQTLINITESLLVFNQTVSTYNATLIRQIDGVSSNVNNSMFFNCSGPCMFFNISNGTFGIQYTGLNSVNNLTNTTIQMRSNTTTEISVEVSTDGETINIGSSLTNVYPISSCTQYPWFYLDSNFFDYFTTTEVESPSNTQWNLLILDGNAYNTHPSPPGSCTTGVNLMKIPNGADCGPLFSAGCQGYGWITQENNKGYNFFAFRMTNMSNVVWNVGVEVSTTVHNGGRKRTSISFALSTGGNAVTGLCDGQNIIPLGTTVNYYTPHNGSKLIIKDIVIILSNPPDTILALTLYKPL